MGRRVGYAQGCAEKEKSTNGNEDLAWALFLASVRGVRAQSDEGSLLAAMRDAIHIAESDWKDAARQIPAARNVKWPQRHLLQLATDGSATRIVAKHWSSGALARVKAVVDSWVTSTVDSSGPACWACERGVRVGVECKGCARTWHYGCLWRFLQTKPSPVAVPSAAQFASHGLHGYTCWMCRQGGCVRAPTRGTLLQRFAEHVDRLSVEDAQAMVRRALDAPGRTRRRLPGRGTRDGGTSAGRFLATAAVARLAQLATDGDRSAELLLLYAPRLFMRKGAGIDQQLADLLEGGKFAASEAPPHDSVRAWAASLEATLEDGCLKKLASVIERGPRVGKLEYTTDDVEVYFPDVVALDDEAAKWQSLRDTLPSRRVGFSATDLRRWAAKHRTSSGGSTGWTGAIVTQVFASDASVGAQLAALWSRAPDDWHLASTVDAALRATDGWPIPKGDSQVRFLAAPQFVRRVASAVQMSRARPLTERYCRERGQYGLSSEPYTLAYSMLPQLTLLGGGTVVVADRSKSFQTFRRDAVYAAVKDVVEHALPSEADAAAALVDACLELYADGKHVTRTWVTFADIDKEYLVDGLAQGCSLSPTLEAVTLAWLQSQSSPQAAGTVRRASHDDLVMIAQAGASLAELRLPDCSLVGGTYNASKSAAFGSSAAALVTAKQAATCEAAVGTIWGRPIGSLPRWLESVWMPRFRQRCARIRTLALVDAAVAIWSAHALRGPGSMCNHALRGIPPAMLDGDDYGGTEARSILRTADMEWVQLIVELTGATPAVQARVDVDHVRRVVFGRTLGHVSAEDVAPAAAAAGLATCFRTMADVAMTQQLDMTVWAKPLGVPMLATLPPNTVTLADVITIAGGLVDMATVAKDAYECALAPGTEKDARYGDDVCLWVEALTAPGALHAAVKAAGGPLGLPGIRSAAVQYALARVVGVPVWQALGGVVDVTRVSSATACGLCQAAISTNAVPLGDDAGCASANPTTQPRVATHSHGGASASAPTHRPRAVFDHTGEHISACARVSRAANDKSRHDLFVRGAVSIATECGIRAEKHDRPVFQTVALMMSRADKRRPADWMEVGGEITSTASDMHYVGRCFDLTIRCGNSAALEQAVIEKHRKYGDALTRNQHVGFTVFGVSTNGRIAPGAAWTLTRWEVNLVRHRRRNADLLGNPRREVRSAVGLLFASVMAAQAAAYVTDINAAASSSHGASSDRLLRVRARAAQSAARRHDNGHSASTPHEATARQQVQHHPPPYKKTRAATAARHVRQQHSLPTTPTAPPRQLLCSMGTPQSSAAGGAGATTLASPALMTAASRTCVGAANADADTDQTIAELDFASDGGDTVTAPVAAVAVNQWTQWNTNSERTVTDMGPVGRVTDGDQDMVTGAGTTTTLLQHASDAYCTPCVDAPTACDLVAAPFGVTSQHT